MATPGDSMISAGIDAGTESYCIVAIEDEEVVYEIEIPTTKVRQNPEIVIENLRECGAEIAAGLSGYGLPIKKFSELDDVDIFLMTLNFEPEQRVGLRRIIEKMKEMDYDLYTIPGVIHLQTIPRWRKINKIDVGTYDKLCSAVLAVYQLSKGANFEDLNFVLAEIGHFNSFLAIKNGKIVDGIGGSSGFPGYGSIGSLDSELAYLLGEFPKKLIYSDGLKDYDWDVLAEYVLKGLRSVEVSIGKADLCMLSGRFAAEVKEYIEEFYEVEILKGFGKGKQSAQGAAIIANAIGGGKFKDLVRRMDIFNAKGTVFDYITQDVMKFLKLGMERRVRF